MIRTLTIVALVLVMVISSMAQDPPPVPKGAPEKVTLDTAIMQSAGSTDFVVQDISFDWRHNIIRIRIGETGEFGRSLEIIEYTGQDARDMMLSLNIANLSVKSLNKRIMEKLQADGHLGSGSITTSP